MWKSGHTNIAAHQTDYLALYLLYTLFDGALAKY